MANSIAGSGANGGTDFRVRQRFGTTVRLPGYGGGATDTAAVVAFIQGRNTGAETGSATVQAPGAGFVGGAACGSAFAVNLPTATNQNDNLARVEKPAPSKHPDNNNASATTTTAKVSQVTIAKTQPASEIKPATPTVSQIIAHHVTKAKRDSGVVVSNSRANSWMKTPTVNAMQDKTRGKVKVRPRVEVLAVTPLTYPSAPCSPARRSTFSSR